MDALKLAREVGDAWIELSKREPDSWRTYALRLAAEALFIEHYGEKEFLRQVKMGRKGKTKK